MIRASMERSRETFRSTRRKWQPTPSTTSPPTHGHHRHPHSYHRSRFFDVDLGRELMKALGGLLAKFRGRDASYLAPPAQIRASPIRAHGSHLGCVTARRDILTKFRMRFSACDTVPRYCARPVLC